jgi:hypothetical protein
VVETQHGYNWAAELDTNPNAASASAHYLIEFGFVFIKQARALLDNHFLKLCRNLVLTFKGVMTKLLQDREIATSKCGKQDDTHEQCSQVLMMNYNDRLAIHSFLQFMIRGLTPIERDKTILIDNVYNDFVQRNFKVLKQTLEFYSS